MATTARNAGGIEIIFGIRAMKANRTRDVPEDEDRVGVCASCEFEVDIEELDIDGVCDYCRSGGGLTSSD